MARLAQDFDLEGVHAAFELPGEGIVDFAVGVYPGEVPQYLGADIDLEMGLPALAPAGMALVLGGDVPHIESVWGKHLCELV